MSQATRNLTTISIIAAILIVVSFAPLFQEIQSRPVLTIQQTSSANPYVATFQISNPRNVSDPVPYVVYPAGDTIWISTTNVFTNKTAISQILNFTAGKAHVVLTARVPLIESVALDQSRNRLWFLANDTLAYYNITTKNPNYVVETTFSSGSNPRYLAIDHSYRLWITLASINQIGMYDPLAKKTSLYAVPSPGAGPWGLTIASDNTVWFAEAFAKKIGHLTPCNQPASCVTEYSPPATVSLAAPVQVALGSDGLVWFTDHGSNQFGSLNPSTREWKVFPIGYCQTDCGSGLPNAISLDSQGNLWFSEHFAGRIAKYEVSTGRLIEYIIHGPTGAFIWWAWPGQNNLVWFSSVGLGLIGYVNASIPINLAITAPSSITLSRGSSDRFPASVNYQRQGTLSLGLSPTMVDAPDTQSNLPPQLYGTLDPSQLGPSSTLQISSVTISSAWNATLGSRNVGLTVSNGDINLNKFVNVTITEPALPYLTLGVGIFMIVAAGVLGLRRTKIVKPVKTTVKKTGRGR